MNKTWDYDEITKKAEQQIKRMVSSDREVVRTFAVGVFLYWNELTLGWQKEGDSKRLEALAG